jgi:alanine-glyoxylate transaminase/serine-glyoxylate transaminase/serine-pyruvate transaminase
LERVFARHARHAEATRAAVRAWGLETQCVAPQDHSPVLTAVRVREEDSADALRSRILERYNMSLGNGLGRLRDRVFRIGHLGDLGDLQLLGALSGIEMGLRELGIPHHAGGVQVAMEYLSNCQ